MDGSNGSFAEIFMAFFVWLIVGGIAGWLAGGFPRGGGFVRLGILPAAINDALKAGRRLPRLSIQVGDGACSAQSSMQVLAR